MTRYEVGDSVVVNDRQTIGKIIKKHYVTIDGREMSGQMKGTKCVYDVKLHDLTILEDLWASELRKIKKGE